MNTESEKVMTAKHYITAPILAASISTPVHAEWDYYAATAQMELAADNAALCKLWAQGIDTDETKAACDFMFEQGNTTASAIAWVGGEANNLADDKIIRATRFVERYVENMTYVTAYLRSLKGGEQ